LLQWACRLLSHRGAAVEVVGLGVGKRFGWFSGVKGFGVASFGSLSSKQKAARRLSKQVVNPGSLSVGASLV